jgi:general secretion pathway protein J
MIFLRGAHTKSRSRGFTLLEMLVAVAIFALASALAYGGLEALMRSRAQLDASQQRLAKLQFAIGLIERDVRSLAARGVRDGYGVPRSALEGTRERIELTRGGYANALALPRAELERVAYRLLDGKLRRERYAVLDRLPGSVPVVDELLDEVQRLEFRYLAIDGRDAAQWPPPRAGSDAPPRAVIVELVLADIGEIRRVLELPQEPAQ